MYTPVKFKKPHVGASTINLTSRNVEKMAYELMRYLWARDLFDDEVRIYYRLGVTWYAIQLDMPTDPHVRAHSYLITHKYRGNEYSFWRIENCNPNDYFEYNGDYLSMSFEGVLYTIMNYLQWPRNTSKVPEQLQNFFSHYGLYYEMGYAWSLSVYK